MAQVFPPICRDHVKAQQSDIKEMGQRERGVGVVQRIKAVEMAQTGKCLLHKLEDLSSDSQHVHKNLVMTVHICNPRRLKQETPEFKAGLNNIDNTMRSCFIKPNQTKSNQTKQNLF